MSLHKSSGNIIVCGDLNGKTGTSPDFVLDENDKHSPVTEIPVYDRDVPSFRRNYDKHPVDKHGKIILEIQGVIEKAYLHEYPSK